MVIYEDKKKPWSVALGSKVFFIEQVVTIALMLSIASRCFLYIINV